MNEKPRVRASGHADTSDVGAATSRGEEARARVVKWRHQSSPYQQRPELSVKQTYNYVYEPLFIPVRCGHCYYPSTSATSDVEIAENWYGGPREDASGRLLHLRDRIDARRGHGTLRWGSSSAGNQNSDGWLIVSVPGTTARWLWDCLMFFFFFLNNLVYPSGPAVTLPCSPHCGAHVTIKSRRG